MVERSGLSLEEYLSTKEEVCQCTTIAIPSLPLCVHLLCSVYGVHTHTHDRPSTTLTADHGRAPMHSGAGVCLLDPPVQLELLDGHEGLYVCVCRIPFSQHTASGSVGRRLVFHSSSLSGLQTWAFMQFGKDWKLFDMSYVHKVWGCVFLHTCMWSGGREGVTSLLTRGESRHVHVGPIRSTQRPVYCKTIGGCCDGGSPLYSATRRRVGVSTHTRCAVVLGVLCCALLVSTHPPVCPCTRQGLACWNFSS